MHEETTFINKDRALYLQFMRSKQNEMVLNSRIDKLENTVLSLVEKLSAVEQRISRIGDDK